MPRNRQSPTITQEQVQAYDGALCPYCDSYDVEVKDAESINGGRDLMFHHECNGCRRSYCESFKFLGIAEEFDQGFVTRLVQRGGVQYQPYTQGTPEIVCLCGSTRFGEAFDRANYEQTLAGRIVLSIGCVTSSDSDLGVTAEQKIELDELHKRKIDLADGVLVLNVGGYIGESTAAEIEHAQRLGKHIEYLEPIE